MATLRRSIGSEAACALAGREGIQAAGIVRDHSGEKSAGNFHAASAVDGRGKPQCSHAMPESPPDEAENPDEPKGRFYKNGLRNGGTERRILPRSRGGALPG